MEFRAPVLSKNNIDRDNNIHRPVKAERTAPVRPTTTHIYIPALYATVAVFSVVISTLISVALASVYVVPKFTQKKFRCQLGMIMPYSAPLWLTFKYSKHNQTTEAECEQ